ncbi:MAG: PAS domain-containing sensor histidine kinase, partial [Nitrospirales bacterium]
MGIWRRPRSLQHKIIAAIVMVGLLPLTVSLVLTYMEQRKAIREAIGANFEQVAVEVARRIEMQVTRGIYDAQQLAAIPFIRTAVIEANRSYEGKDPRRIRSMIRDWQRRWRERESQNEFPLFVNSIATSYLMQWHDIRTADYIGILVTDNQGALVLSSIPQVEYDYGSSGWWKSVLSGGRGQIYVGDIYNSFDPS